MKITRSILHQILFSSLNNKESECITNSLNSSGRPITNMIDSNFTNCFCERWTWLYAKCRKKTKSWLPWKIDRQISYHLPNLSSSFNDGEIDEQDEENIDETYFYMTWILASLSEHVVIHVQVTMTLLWGVQVWQLFWRFLMDSKQRWNRRFLIVNSQFVNYPIHGVPYVINAVSYKTYKKLG